MHSIRPAAIPPVGAIGFYPRAWHVAAQRLRRSEGFGADALQSVALLFKKVGAEIDAPKDRADWTRKDYEKERTALQKKLVRVAKGIAALKKKNAAQAKEIADLRARLGSAPSGKGTPARTSPPKGRGADEADDEDDDSDDDAIGYRRGFRGRHPSFLGHPVRSALTAHTTIETAPGVRTVVVPLDETGVFLVAEADNPTIRSIPAPAVGAAIESAAADVLSGRHGAPWTRHLAGAVAGLLGGPPR